MQPLSDQSIIATITAAQRYDSAAFDQLYTHYADALFRYLYARCGDPALAEELLSDLWLRVVERIGAFRQPARGADLAFSGWLYQIARNLVIDYYRRNKRPQVPLHDAIQSNEPDLGLNIEHMEDKHAIKAALDGLTPDQRTVVVLRFFEERSSAEVAALTGRTETAVKALQHRALAALARALGNWRDVEAA